MYFSLTILLTAGTALIPVSLAAPSRQEDRLEHFPRHHTHRPGPWFSGRPGGSNIDLPSSAVGSSTTRRISSKTSASVSIPSTTKVATVSTTLSTQVGSSTSSKSTPSSSKSSAAAAATGFWKPTVGTTWQIQLSSSPSTSGDLPFSVYDIDLFDNTAATITALHSKGRKVICYFSAGTREGWREDASSFVASDLGSAMEDWAGEKWLATGSANVRAIMTARIDLAKEKGCDGIDPDNVDAYNNENGLGLTSSDAVSYLTFLADAAHSRGLSIGLKNAGDIVGDVLPLMQWEVNEQCVEYEECDLFVPFVDAGKPVFHIEYPSGAPSLSDETIKSSCARPAGFSSLLKDLDLDAWVETC